VEHSQPSKTGLQSCKFFTSMVWDHEVGVDQKRTEDRIQVIRKPLFGEWSETRKLSRYGVRGDENASDIASRSPATNAIRPFPESSGPRRFQET
jgi:hypothetical protein